MTDEQLLNLTHYPRQISSPATLEVIKALAELIEFGFTYGFKTLDTPDGWEIVDACQDALGIAENELFREE